VAVLCGIITKPRVGKIFITKPQNAVKIGLLKWKLTTSTSNIRVNLKSLTVIGNGTTSSYSSSAIDGLLEVRTTKWQKQLPTTMQCRSHSPRLTSKCLFVTACSMDQYAEKKRTEKNLIVRSGISEAETTNNKTVRSTFCTEAIETRSIARPLCDSRATCLFQRWGRVVWPQAKWHVKGYVGIWVEVI